MGDLIDPRLTAWRDESVLGHVVWRRAWTIGRRYRAAVAYDTPGRPEPFGWAAFPVEGGELRTPEFEGFAGSALEARSQGDQGLTLLLRTLSWRGEHVGCALERMGSCCSAERLGIFGLPWRSVGAAAGHDQCEPRAELHAGGAR